MGSADVVPGVSGGTVALVTGIYQRLVSSISAGSSGLGRFARGDIRGGMAALKRVDWWFLSALERPVSANPCAPTHLVGTACN